MDLYFYLILAIATVFGVSFAISTKGIYFSTPDTDNELMTYAAAQSHKWRWLSDVYKYSASKVKVAMKEWTVILLSIFQRIFKDRTTNRPYTIMTGLAVSASTLLIYLIAADYFNQSVGMIVAILYIISFWPWQVALYGGHVNIANLFFLLSVYIIQIAANMPPIPLFALIAAGGAFFGFCLFSSPSAHKYFIAVFAALFFNAHRGFFTSHEIGKLINALPLNLLLPLDIIFAVVFLSVWVIILLTYKSAIKKMYDQKAPRFLNNVISDRDRFPLEHYITHANKKVKMLIRWSFWIFFSLFVLINFVPMYVLLAFASGFIFTFLMITLPNIKDGMTEYFTCMLVHKRRSHFKYYIDDFAKIGVAVRRTTRGAGLSWVPKTLWIFAPFHSTLFVATFTIGLYKSVGAGDIYQSIFLVVVAFVSLSPIVWAEITGAPQVARTYSPGLIIGLLLPAYVIFNIDRANYALTLLGGLLALTFIWNFWKFVNDVYPSRMTVRNLVKVADKLGIKDIYTYKTSLNNHLVGAIPGIGKSEYLPQSNAVPPFRVHYIQRLDEVTDGWIAIPGTNRIAMAMGKEENDDYASDPLRKHLTETGQLEQIAAFKFKTYSTSNIWPNEDEVTSYCFLYMKNNDPNVLRRGYAWLVHSSKLKEFKYLNI